MTDQTSVSATLKPCPFCGGNGAITLGVSPRGIKTVDVICQDCSGTMPAFCEEDAVADWNVRPDDQMAIVRSPEWLAGEKRIHDRERADRERSGHAVQGPMHKGAEP